MNHTDQTLIEALIVGEKGAINYLTLIITKNAKLVCARYKLQEETEDLISETIVAFWAMDKEKLRPIENLRGFLYRITFNKAMDILKSKGKMRIVSEDQITEQGEVPFFSSSIDQNLIELVYEKLQTIDIRMYLLASLFHAGNLGFLEAMIFIEGTMPSKLSLRDKLILPRLSSIEKVNLIVEVNKSRESEGKLIGINDLELERLMVLWFFHLTTIMQDEVEILEKLKFEDSVEDLESAYVSAKGEKSRNVVAEKGKQLSNGFFIEALRNVTQNLKDKIGSPIVEINIREVINNCKSINYNIFQQLKKEIELVFSADEKEVIEAKLRSAKKHVFNQVKENLLQDHRYRNGR